VPDWIEHYLPYLIPSYIVGMWILVTYLIAVTGGWRLLAKRFRLQGDFVGQKWNLQSARMRGVARYNNALTVGADETGLFFVPFILFRVWHPALFVPWGEITVLGKTKLFFVQYLELRLGRTEAVPFTIRMELAEKLQTAAGKSWPTGNSQAWKLQQPPPPIG